MPQHPVTAAGGKKAHVRAFEVAAIGMVPRCHPETLAWLIGKGLLERLPDKTVGKDAFGKVTVPQYAVPLSVHAQWCAWASTRPNVAETE